MDICVNFPDCHGRAEFCCHDCHLQREQGVNLCEDCTNKIHATHFCKSHNVVPLEPKTTERRLSQDVSTFESFVTVQKDIFHQITSKVLSIEHEDKEFLSVVQQTLGKRAREMKECKDRINKAMQYLDKVSLALSECSDLSDKAKFSVLQSAIAPTDGESAEKLSGLLVKVVGSFKKNGSFWACKCGAEESSSLDQLHTNMKTFFQEKGFDGQPAVEEGMLCAVKRNVAGEPPFVRARVEKVLSSLKVAVRYLDRGSTEDIAVAQLANLPEQFKQLDFQAFECCLFSNLNHSLPYDAVWCFKDYTNKRKLVAELQEQVPNSSVMHVVLKTLDSPPICVNQRVRAKVDECTLGSKDKPVMPKETVTAGNRTSSANEASAKQQTTIDMKESTNTERPGEGINTINSTGPIDKTEAADKLTPGNMKDIKSNTTAPTDWGSTMEASEEVLLVPRPGYVNTTQRETILRNCAEKKIPEQSLLQARYFILRDELKTVVEAMKQGKWCANHHILRVLNKAFHEQDRLGRRPLFIVFHVLQSDDFAGVAQMISTVDYKNYSTHFSELASTSSQSCSGGFSLHWIYVHSLPLKQALTSHVGQGYDNLRTVKTLRSGKELPTKYGAWLLKRFDEHTSDRSVLNQTLVKGRRPSLRNEQRPVKAISPDTQVGEEKESQVVEPPENRESAFEVQTSENWEQEVTTVRRENDDKVQLESSKTGEVSPMNREKDDKVQKEGSETDEVSTADNETDDKLSIEQNTKEEKVHMESSETDEASTVGHEKNDIVQMEANVSTEQNAKEEKVQIEISETDEASTVNCEKDDEIEMEGSGTDEVLEQVSTMNQEKDDKVQRESSKTGKVSIVQHENQDSEVLQQSEKSEILIRAVPDGEESEKTGNGEEIRNIECASENVDTETKSDSPQREGGGEQLAENELSKTTKPVAHEKNEVTMPTKVNGDVAGLDEPVDEGNKVILNSNKGEKSGTSPSIEEDNCVSTLSSFEEASALKLVTELKLQNIVGSSDVKPEKLESETVVESLVTNVLDHFEISPQKKTDDYLKPKEKLSPTAASVDEQPTTDSTAVVMNREPGYVVREVNTGNGQFKLMLRETKSHIPNEEASPTQKVLVTDIPQEQTSFTTKDSAYPPSEESGSRTSGESYAISESSITPSPEVEPECRVDELVEGRHTPDPKANPPDNKCHSPPSKLRATAAAWYPHEQWAAPSSPRHTLPDESWVSGDAESPRTSDETIFEREGQEFMDEEYDEEEEEEEEMLFPVSVGGTYPVRVVGDLRNDETFWCRLYRSKEEEMKFKDFMARMHASVERLGKPLKPVHLLKECCVYDSKRWNRGYIEKIDKRDPRMVSVRFTDDGIRKICQKESLRQLDVMYHVSLPQQAFECVLAKREQYSDREIRRLHEYVRSFRWTTIEVLEIEGTTAIVKFDQQLGYY